MKDGLYQIGDVANIFNLSVQTLRLYERMNLFVPVVKDESTGYRYYKLEQFERLRQILFLRDFGLRLKDIKRQLDVQNYAEYLKLLENNSSTLERRIRSDTKLKQFIDNKTENMKRAADLPQNKTLFLFFSDQKVLRHKCEFYRLQKIEPGIIELIAKYHLKANIDSVGQFISRESFIKNGELVTTGLFVTEEVFTDDTYSKFKDNIITIPGGLYATMYYQNFTNQSLPYIQKLLDDIERNLFIPFGNIIRSIIFDLGRGKETKDGYLACIRVLVKNETSDITNDFES